VAVKVLHKAAVVEEIRANFNFDANAQDLEDANSDLVNFLDEVNTMSNLRHPNLALFMGVVVDGPQFMIVSQLCGRGSLWEVLRDPTIQLDFDLRKNIATDATFGVNHLHLCNIVHCDIKTPNLLVTTNFHVRLTDFGMARWLRMRKGKGSDRPAGTRHEALMSSLWSAPEVLKGEECSEKSDIYSLGTCLWETLTRLMPYDGVHTNCVQLRVANDKSQYTPEVSALEQNLFTKFDDDSPPGQFLAMIRSCWSKDPSLRPSCDAILSQLRGLHFPNYQFENESAVSGRVHSSDFEVQTAMPPRSDSYGPGTVTDIDTLLEKTINNTSSTARTKIEAIISPPQSPRVTDQTLSEGSGGSDCGSDVGRDMSFPRSHSSPNQTPKSEPDGAALEPAPRKCIHNEWILSLNDFSSFGPSVGVGAFGEVQVAMYQKNTKVALKSLGGQSKDYEATKDKLAIEMSLMSGLKHENVIESIGILVNPPIMCLVLEFADLGNLKDAILGRGQLKGWEDTISFSLDAARGMEYLHSR
jgi:serine/threonine protein kinase